MLHKLWSPRPCKPFTLGPKRPLAPSRTESHIHVASCFPHSSCYSGVPGTPHSINSLGTSMSLAARIVLAGSASVPRRRHVAPLALVPPLAAPSWSATREYPRHARPSRCGDPRRPPPTPSPMMTPPARKPPSRTAPADPPQRRRPTRTSNPRPRPGPAPGPRPTWSDTPPGAVRTGNGMKQLCGGPGPPHV